MPLIRQYEDIQVNAYDLPLGLDRVAKGETEAIPFRLTPTTNAGSNNGVRLTPAKPLTDGVYFAYSLPEDTHKYEGLVHGLLFAVRTHSLSAANPIATQPQPNMAPTGSSRTKISIL